MVHNVGPTGYELDEAGEGIGRELVRHLHQQELVGAAGGQQIGLHGYAHIGRAHLRSERELWKCGQAVLGPFGSAILHPFFQQGDLLLCEHTLPNELGIVRIGGPWRHNAAAGHVGIGYGIFAGIGIGDQRKVGTPTGTVANGAVGIQHRCHMLGKGDGCRHTIATAARLHQKGGHGCNNYNKMPAKDHSRFFRAAIYST